ncbi:hypothetical protein BHE74_00054443 [Ensete ventricosum]|nr:hypothetical protein GW17_00026825 [Ensete ventricosum]RWW40161.1 hypothetical protein BHE74_00054443 [Ensete ventricosum]
MRMGAGQQTVVEEHLPLRVLEVASLWGWKKKEKGDVASHVLPTQGDISSPRAERTNRLWATDRTARGDRAMDHAMREESKFSSSFSLPRLRPLEISRRWSKSISNGRFRVVIGGNHRYLVVPPGSGRFAYRSADGPVHTARYGALLPGKANLRLK